MKYALITEEEIQQLRFHVQHLKQVDPVSLSHASLILDSLKPSEPFGFVTRDAKPDSTVWLDSERHIAYSEPLFALESKHD